MNNLSIRFVMEMIGCILEVMGEKEIFSPKEYEQIKNSMGISATPSDTLKTLEDILKDLKANAKK